MDVATILAYLFGIISTIVIGIVTNLLTTYLFPDGGKKMVSSLIFVLLNSFYILLNLSKYALLLWLFILWLNNPHIIGAVGLGFNIAMIMTINLAQEIDMQERIITINRNVDKLSQISETSVKSLLSLQEAQIKANNAISSFVNPK
jgi:hypothetical protein